MSEYTEIELKHDPRGYWELNIQGGPRVEIWGLTRFALALALNEGGGYVPMPKGWLSVNILLYDAPQVVLIYYERDSLCGSYELSAEDSLKLYNAVNSINQINWGESDDL